MTLPQPEVPAAHAGIRPDSAERRYSVEFTATAGEYFRIWIVNLALTVLTLGIYSAWAKVRKRRYFYSHTRIDGEGFEYRANPLAILKGRLIAVALLVLFYGVGYFSPLYQLLLWIPIAIVAPWLLVRSFAFNAYNTAYRNVRFLFRGTYKGCLKVILVYGWLVFAGILYPYFKHRLLRFIGENHAYGTTSFTLADFKKPFIGAYAKGYGLGLLLVIGSIALVAIHPALLLLMYVGFLLVFVYIRARTTNALWNAVSIGPVRFECSMRARDLAWLYLTNVLGVLITLGLATPWAVVRSMRYRAAKLVAVAAGPLDSFAQAEAQQVSVTGEEVGEMLDIDIAL